MVVDWLNIHGYSWYMCEVTWSSSLLVGHSLSLKGGSSIMSWYWALKWCQLWCSSTFLWSCRTWFYRHTTVALCCIKAAVSVRVCRTATATADISSSLWGLKCRKSQHGLIILVHTVASLINCCLLNMSYCFPTSHQIVIYPFHPFLNSTTLESKLRFNISKVSPQENSKMWTGNFAKVAIYFIIYYTYDQMALCPSFFLHSMTLTCIFVCVFACLCFHGRNKMFLLGSSLFWWE